MGDRPYRSPFHANVEALLRRPGIGHNQGPPLDMSFEGWVWRRAVKAAWKTPPREIALRRMARAEAMGLTYREYTAVLMDRGRSVNTLVFSLGALVGETRPVWGRNVASALQPQPTVAATFAELKPQHLLVVADRYSEERLMAGRSEEELRDSLAGFMGALTPELAVVDSGLRRPRGTPDPRVAAVNDFLARRFIVGTEAVMVGLGAGEAYVSETCGLALFKFAWDYFSPVPVR
jgi:hypothetical protein